MLGDETKRVRDRVRLSERQLAVGQRTGYGVRVEATVFDREMTVVTSQLPVDKWHDVATVGRCGGR